METIPSFVIVSSARSGTNFLCSYLVKMEKAAAYYELLSENGSYGLERQPKIAETFRNLSGIDVAASLSPEFAEKMRAQPVRNLNLLRRAAAMHERKFLSYKVFPEQINVTRLLLALSCPQTMAIFLVRRRIDMFISFRKATATQKWTNLDTTKHRPHVELDDYIEWVQAKDEWFDRVYNRVTKEGIPYVVLTYEDDVLLPHEQLVERLKDIGRKLDVEFVLSGDGDVPTVFKRQDHELDPFAKIENGDEFRSKLQDAGLLDKALLAPLANYRTYA